MKRVALGVVMGLSLAWSAMGDSPSRWEEVVALAREAARTDRNAESAALFKQAVALDGARRLEILRELADQMTYSGETAKAVPLYGEVLASGTLSSENTRRAQLGLALALSWSGQPHESIRVYETVTRSNPRDMEALLGRARVLSWLDRNEESQRLYLVALLIEPANREALRNLGRVTSWRGRQREARDLLENYLRDNASDTEALFLLGQAEHWLGRPDRSLAALARVTTLNDDATRLRDDVARAQSSETRLETRGSTQSDDLRIVRSHLQHLQRFRGGLAQAGVSFQRIDYDPDSGQGVAVDRPGLSTRWRFSDAWEWNGMAWLDRIRSRHGSRDVTTFDSWATYWPDDFLRFDLSAARSVPDNIRSLEQGITATSLSLSGDFVPNERMKFNARAGLGRYSDGNRTVFASAEIERRVMRRPPLRLGFRTSAFHFQEQKQNGYFDPDRFLAAAITARMAGRLRDGVWYGVFAAGGYETVRPGDDKPQYSMVGNLSWQLSRRFQVELRADTFSSKQASSSGFARDTVEIALRYTPLR